MDKQTLEVRKQQYSARYDELSKVIRNAQDEQQQLSGAFQLVEELLKEQEAGAASGKAKDGPKPASTVRP